MQVLDVDYTFQVLPGKSMHPVCYRTIGRANAALCRRKRMKMI